MNRCIHPNQRRTSLPLRVYCVFLIFALSACSSIIKPQPTPIPTSGTDPSDITPQVEITFIAELTKTPPSGSEIQLSVLDEVTGLAVAPTSSKMSPVDDLHYQVKISTPLNSIVKYRYTQAGNQPRSEISPSGSPIRYRVVKATGTQAIEDVISAWQGEAFSGKTGRITGRVTNQEDGSPIPDLMVFASGIFTVTGSDGAFILENIPQGVRQIVVFSLDGKYQVFQQGAKVEAGLTTPADIQVHPGQEVKVTFQVKPPAENVIGLPIRLAGNLYQLGNTFSDLPGGSSIRAIQMPLMTRQSDGTYQLTLSLTAGTDLAYKYSLGDGLWNAELTQAGAPVLRHLIIPDHDTIVNDTIATWRTPNQAPVTFQVTTPANTPAGESVSIQFNISGWSEPLPMWPLGGNRWIYILYNTLPNAGKIGYHYCRNSFCGSSEQSSSPGAVGVSSEFSPTEAPRQVNDTIESWEWWQPSGEPTTIVSRDPRPRSGDFSAGVEFQPGLDPAWVPYLPANYQQLKGIGSNSVVLTPSWSITGTSPVVINLVPGRDSLWNDLYGTINQAQEQGLRVILSPSLRYPELSSAWWQKAPRDPAWWTSWFEQYRQFILYYADLAAKTNSYALVIGGEDISPTLPNGVLNGGITSGVPGDSAERWQSLIADIRSHYQGELIWALPYNQASDLDNSPQFIQDADLIYLLWSVPLAENPSATEPDLEQKVTSLVEQQVKPFVDKIGKPVWVGLAYASSDQASRGCILVENSLCLTQSTFNNHPALSVNLQAQLDIYNAIFATFNSYEWIGGVISRGYYPPVPLQDASASVHGKPASDVLWYWFPKFVSSQ